VHLQPCHSIEQPAWRLFPATSKPRLVGSLISLASLLLFHGDVEVVYGQQDSPQKQQTVLLIIDFGDQSQKHFTGIPWNKEMTIQDVLQAASKHPRGIRFEHRGKGKTAFLLSIDKLKNEGRGRNWIFRVNKKLGDRSFADSTVQPGDTILWTFGKYR
jgi:hypothetical protein